MNRVRVLLVDDEPATGEVLAGWMLRHGFEVVYVDGPERADAALANAEFDVVLSDIQMPGNFKLEWIAHRLSTDCPTPILLMTGNPELETAMRAANLPIAGYLVKPLFFEEVAAQIERLAADKRRRKELLALSREVAQLVPASTSSVDPITRQLHRLAREFAQEASRSPRDKMDSDQTAPWRAAINDTIAVLEKTKHSFRSKDLGELRRRLQHLVPAQPAAGATKISAELPKVGAI